MTPNEIKARYLAGERDFTRVDLRGADLEGADLEGANLVGANLVGADLVCADLVGADLTDVNLTRAALEGADLRYALLTDANLEGANLVGADLRGAALNGADLTGANLDGADIRGADLEGADLTRAKLPSAPVVVPDLDRRILSILDGQKGKLNMGAWHRCETTHCLAGWAIHLAGEKGYALESKVGAAVAGTLIYWHSTGSVPNFFADADDALAELRARAERCNVPSGWTPEQGGAG